MDLFKYLISASEAPITQTTRHCTNRHTQEKAREENPEKKIYIAAVTWQPRCPRHTVGKRQSSINTARKTVRPHAKNGIGSLYHYAYTLNSK